MLFLHHINTGPLCLIILHHVLTTSPHSLPSSFLAWAVRKLLKKKVFWSRKKAFWPATKNYPDVSHQFATQLLYIQHENSCPTAKIGCLVKVWKTLLRLLVQFQGHFWIVLLSSGDAPSVATGFPQSSQSVVTHQRRKKNVYPDSLSGPRGRLRCRTTAGSLQSGSKVPSRHILGLYFYLWLHRDGIGTVFLYK